MALKSYSLTLSLPDHPRALLGIVARYVGPRPCAHCQTDLLTNGHVTVSAEDWIQGDGWRATWTLRCDCGHGSLVLTQQDIEDAVKPR